MGNRGVSNSSLLFHNLVIDLEALAFKAENVRESSKSTNVDPRGGEFPGKWRPHLAARRLT